MPPDDAEAPTAAEPDRPSSTVPPSTVSFTLDGVGVIVADDGFTLLEALRGPLGARSVKDGCSPQGQCGCCTVLVDGTPRVACVTPLRRVGDRDVVTFDGLGEEVRRRWAEAFVAHGASQCGFCSPGIVVRLESLRRRAAQDGGVLREGAVDRALAAHLCRCTGWQTIVEAAHEVISTPGGAAESGDVGPERDLDEASRRATLELGAPQRVGVEVVAGAVGFSADTAPDGSLVAVRGPQGGWAVGGSMADARRNAGKVQGRRTTLEAAPVLELPDGDFEVTLRTSWVDPAYVETDASWCEPGGDPSPAAANGGAFGAKRRSPVPAEAAELAELHRQPVLALWSREDCCRSAPKRPPIAAGLRSDGTGVVHVVRTDGIADRIRSVLPDVDVVELDVTGPPTSVDLRAAGWAEAVVLAAGAQRGGAAPAGDVVVATTLDDGSERVEVRTADGAEAEVTIGDGGVDVRVRAGEVLDAVVLRSYCIGAVHMALGWVTSEGLAVDADGEVLDLTVRSLGVLRSSDLPPIRVGILPGDGPAVRVSDAVFAATAAAQWRLRGCPQDWPTG